jgi:hypothetical protein|tara:strand:- start:214 stop:363 length:150 start_codon:yes stop_codon:yes gene_type:complete
MQDSACLLGGERNIESSAEGALVVAKLPLTNPRPMGYPPTTRNHHLPPE